MRMCSLKHAAHPSPNLYKGTPQLVGAWVSAEHLVRHGDSLAFWFKRERKISEKGNEVSDCARPSILRFAWVTSPSTCPKAANSPIRVSQLYARGLFVGRGKVRRLNLKGDAVVAPVRRIVGVNRLVVVFLIVAQAPEPEDYV